MGIKTSGSRENFKAHPGTATLVVEVSVSTLAEDRAMAEIYAEAGVEEFWIINAVERCIEVLRQPHGGIYAVRETFGQGQSLTCSALPVTVDVTALFTGLPDAAA